MKDALTKDNPDGSPSLTVRWSAVKQRPLANNSNYDIGLLGNLQGGINTGPFKIQLTNKLGTDAVFGAKFGLTGQTVDLLSANPKYNSSLQLTGCTSATFSTDLLNVAGDLACTGLVSGTQGLIAKLAMTNTQYLPADPTKNVTYLYNSTQTLPTPGVRLYNDGTVSINRVGVPTGAAVAVSGKVDLDN